MKTYFLLYFFFASTTLLLAQPATNSFNGSYQNQTLEQIIQDLEHRYALHFFYKKEWLSNQAYALQFDSLNITQLAQQLSQKSTLGTMILNAQCIVLAPKKELNKTYSTDYFIAKYQSNNNSFTNKIFTSIGDSSQLKTSGTALIQGVIKDASTEEPLINATILLEKTDYSAVTNTNGAFKFEVPVGRYQANLQSIGYESITQNIHVWNDGIWNPELFPQTYELGEIVVAEQANDNNVTSAQVGVTQLSTQAIKELPAFMGEADVVKSLLTLPGVSTVGEGATGFNVRGGAIDQNLIMQDEGMIFNSSHALGFFSIFNPDAIREVTLYKGNIPAQFGGRLSSVLDIETKNADFEKIQLSGGLGLFSSKMTVEVPLKKNKTSLLLSGRGAYPDWLLKQVKNIDVRKSSAFFYDFNGKLTHLLGAGSSISLSHYQSFDRLRFADDFGFEWANTTTSLQWKQILSPTFSLELNAIRGGLDNRLFEPTGVTAFNLDSGLNYYKGKVNLFISAIPQHEIHLGVEGTRYISSPEILQQRGDVSEITPLEVSKDQGQELAVYINDEFSLNERLSLSLGLRYSYFQQLGPETALTYQEGLPISSVYVIDSTTVSSGKVQDYGGIEPRASLRFSLAKDRSIKLSYNHMRQYIHLLSNTTAATPVDVWQLSTRYIPPQVANNFSLGYFQNFKDNLWEYSFEVYYRNLPKLIEYKDFAQLLLKEHIETEVLIGKGWAYGAELSLTKTAGRMKGRLSYTFSRSFREVKGNTINETINGGDRFPANFDQPHNFKFNTQIELSKKTTFSLNFAYNTGRPITVPTAAYTVNGIFVADYSLRNQFRIPDYHRLDIAYTLVPRAIRKGRYQGSWTLSIYNLYGRKNAFSVFFRRGEFGQPQAFKLSVLGAAFPALTYNMTL